MHKKAKSTSLAIFKAAPPSAETKQAMELYTRAAADKDFPLERLEKIMEMRNALIAKDNENAWIGSMAQAQKKMKAIVANAPNKQTSSRYATYDALDAAVRPIYSSHGFMLTFDTEDTDKQDNVRVVCFVSCCGHTRRYHIDIPADGKGARGGDVMSRTHATKSAISYGQSTLLTMIFNLAVSGKRDDDDGNAAGRVEVTKISDEQLKKLRDLVKEVKANLPMFCALFNIKTLDQLPAALFDEAVAQLNRKRKAATKQQQEPAL